MGSHESTGSREVLADGVLYEVVWTGATMNPYTGSKGGLLSFHHEDPAPFDAEPIPPQYRGPKYAHPCKFCSRPMNKPPWLARRHPYCGRTCALKARHARQRAARQPAVDPPSSPS